MPSRNSARATDIAIKDLEAQGARVKRTSKGWLIMFPDGTATALHYTFSDHRSIKNFRAVVKRAGFTTQL